MLMRDPILAILCVIAAVVIFVMTQNDPEPCWNYNIIIEVSYIDGTKEEIELRGTTPGDYYIGPSKPYPDRPRIEIISTNGQAVLVHYPNCGEGPPIIAAWRVGMYRVTGMSRAGCFPQPCV